MSRILGRGFVACAVFLVAADVNGQEFGVRILADSNNDPPWLAETPILTDPPRYFVDRREKPVVIDDGSYVTRFLNWFSASGLVVALFLGIAIVCTSCRRKPRNPMPIINSTRHCV